MNSLEIILKLHKSGEITDKEATQLITDVCNNNSWYYPYYPWVSYQTTPASNPGKFTITSDYKAQSTINTSSNHYHYD